ncbi:MAG TPA: peptidoglycan DD-metalloendopeptidase family protein [Acetobacteraceae bacterium]|nr:peptidoglycan DD-metalloendopeptidase family protein [Acetobacteraceae bacterium]
MRWMEYVPRKRRGGWFVAPLACFIGTMTLPASPALAAPCPIVLPVAGELSSGFGRRWRRSHPGVDLAAPVGTPVMAPVGGTVVFAGRSFGYGLMVEIEHRDGSRARYAHLSGFAPGVSAGATVAPGQRIGAVGRTGRTTGAHLHVELRRNGRAEDPWPWLTRTACLDERQLAEAGR